MTTQFANASGNDSAIEVARDKLVTQNDVVQDEKNAWVDFGFSSWLPSNIVTQAKIGSNIPFSRGNIPGVKFDYSFQVNDSRTLNVVLGLNWLTLSRSTSIGVGGANNTVVQDANLFSGRVGIEYSPDALKSKVVETYFSGALLPTTILTGMSVYEDGSSYSGLPIEFAIGARTPVSTLGVQVQNVDIDVSVLRTFGRIQSSDMGAYGVVGGVRVML